MARMLNHRSSTYPQDIYEDDAAPTAPFIPLPPRPRPLDRASRPKVQPAAPANDTDHRHAGEPDFTAELEEALLNGLASLGAGWDDPQSRAPEHPRWQPEPEPADIDAADALERDHQADRRAFEKLLLRGRRQVEIPAPERAGLAVDAPLAAPERATTLDSDHDGTLRPKPYRPQPPRAGVAAAAILPEPALEPLPLPAESAGPSRRVRPREELSDVAIGGRGRRGLMLAVAAAAVVALGGVLATQQWTARAPQAAGVPVAKSVTAAPVVAAAAVPVTKESYDRAAADPSLPQSTQIRGTAAPITATVSAPMTALQAASNDAATPSMTMALPLQPNNAPTGPAATASTDAGLGKAGPTPPVAESRAAVAASPAPAQPASRAVSAAAIAGPARIVSSVKLRGGPDNGAAAIGVLNAGTTVDVVRCKGWCQIIAGGKEGYVYQKFLSGVGVGTASARAGKAAVQSATTGAGLY